jgi:serine/threonine protein kinase/WD40 repeat protein
MIPVPEKSPAKMEEETIFAQAIEIGSPVECAAFLDQACSGNIELRARLERLLHAHFHPDPHLDAPPNDLAATAADELVRETVGSAIGPYRLLEQIGEGGMGLVFMAEQQRPIRRTVALKIIKPGMDSRQVIARFEAERQTLALMDHPNIAKILDSGTTESGRPYFVMELVRGVSIIDYCDQAELAPRERLELFVTICHAVQHAHQHGIIHRDLKPSNLLVTMHDNIAVPKVIDFGVAKATNRQAVEHTLFTGFAQMVGTPLYMSPEQAQMSDLDVDTRSDVYSLGVLLYELLTGTPPFDRDRLRAAGHEELRRIIREEEPPPMSLRLSTLAAEKLSTVSQKRRTDARKLGSLLHGDLDWIVMKALEKNRERRYESASAFAADVQRYLNDLPVEAGPPSTIYRLRKFLRRNRLLSLATGVVASFLLISAIGLGFGNLVISREREQALEQQKIARASERKARDSETALRRYLYAADMQLARLAYDKADLAATREILQRHRPSGEMPDNRGFEWHYLWGLCADAPRSYHIHDADVFHTCASPDGNLLASASSDQTVKVWAIALGKSVATLRDFNRDVNSTAFSADGTLLATAEEASLARLWDWRKGREIARFTGSGLPVVGVFFTPDQQSLFAIEMDHATKSKLRTTVWDLETQTPRKTLDGYRGLAIHTGRQLLAACNGADELSLWSLPDFQCKSTWRSSNSKILCGNFALDGRLLATGTSTGKIQLTDLQDLSTREFSHEPPQAIRSVAFSDDGQLLVSAADNVVRFWDVSSGTTQKVLASTHGRHWWIEFLSRQSTLATSCGDGTVLLHDLSTMVLEKRRIFESPKRLGFVAMDSQAVRLAVNDSDWSNVLILNMEDGQKQETIRNPTGQVVTAVTFSADDRSVWFADRDELVCRYNLESDAPCESFQSGNWPANELSTSANGRWLASNYAVWDLRSGQKAIDLGSKVGRSQIEENVFVLPASLTDRIVYASRPGTAVFGLELATSQKLPQQFDSHGFISGMAVSPDGKTLAIGSTGGAIYLWDAATAVQLATLHGHRDAPDRIVFSADGLTLVSGSNAGEIKLWNLATRQPIFDLTGHSGKIRYLRFSADGRRLVSAADRADGGGEVFVWGSAKTSSDSASAKAIESGVKTK